MPDRKIRWGVLSTSKIARTTVIPAIQSSRNGTVVAIASRDLAKARQTAGELGIACAYGSYEELLADPEIDAIYNPLPVALHAEWSIRCAEAGKPTLCEKPLARDAAEARRMVEVFERRGVPLAEGFMYRFHPLSIRARELATGGAIGQVQTIRASFNALIENDDDIRFRADLGGGALRDVGCYCVGLMRWVTGEEPSGVSAFARFGEKSQVDEILVATLEFPSGVLGYLGCSLRTPFDCSYDICGTRGRVLVDFGGLVAWPGGEFKIRFWHGAEYEEIAVAPANHYRLMAEDFADAVLTGRPPRYPARDAVANMEVLDRLLASARG